MPPADDICIRLRILNSQNQPLGGTVNIEFQPQEVGSPVTLRNIDASKDIDVSDLQRAPQGLYEVTVTPTNVFKPNSQFLNIPASGFITAVFTFGGKVMPRPSRVQVLAGLLNNPAVLQQIGSRVVLNSLANIANIVGAHPTFEDPPWGDTWDDSGGPYPPHWANNWDDSGTGDPQWVDHQPDWENVWNQGLLQGVGSVLTSVTPTIFVNQLSAQDLQTLTNLKIVNNPGVNE
jgi:hypothetical protein